MVTRNVMHAIPATIISAVGGVVQVTTCPVFTSMHGCWPLPVEEAGPGLGPRLTLGVEGRPSPAFRYWSRSFLAPVHTIITTEQITITIYLIPSQGICQPASQRSSPTRASECSGAFQFPTSKCCKDLTYDNHKGTDHDYNLPHPPPRDFSAGYNRSEVFPGHRVQTRIPVEGVAVPSNLKHRTVGVAVTNPHESHRFLLATAGIHVISISKASGASSP